MTSVCSPGRVRLTTTCASCSRIRLEKGFRCVAMTCTVLSPLVSSMRTSPWCMGAAVVAVDAGDHGSR